MSGLLIVEIVIPQLKVSKMIFGLNSVCTSELNADGALIPACQLNLRFPFACCFVFLTLATKGKKEKYQLRNMI